MHRGNRLSQSLLIATVSVSCVLMGCSVQPIRTAVVRNSDLTLSCDSVPADQTHTSEPQQTTVRVNWSKRVQIHPHLGQANYCRVKYHSSYARKHWMVVEGTVAGQNKYPVVLDTGASPALVLNSIHAQENGLTIQPWRERKGRSAGWSTCHLPELQIGDVTLSDWPSLCGQQRVEVKVFGFPVSKSKAIIAGMPTLRRFSYIAFDSIRKEVEFSLEKVFEAKHLDSWSQYTFVIEEDLAGNAFLFVRIPIANIQTELQLDTGSGRGLAIGDELWEVLNKTISETKLRKTTELYPYIGKLPCKQAVIPSLQVGDRVVRNAKISIFPKNSPLLDGCNGLLGMQYFADTVLVLDFKRNLMWVKKT